MVQASYEFLSEPRPLNLVRLSLTAQNESMTFDNQINGRQQITLDPMDFHDHVIGMRNNNSSIANATGPTSGELRLIRSGFSLEEYYYSLGKWIPIYSGHANPIDVNIILQIDTHGVFLPLASKDSL